MTLIPRGIRNNNPGNIRHSAAEWNGLAARQDDDSFVQFRDMAHGVRAMCKVLLNYQDIHGINTVEGIIKRWAPSSENDTDAYIDYVCHRTGWSQSTPLRLRSFPVMFQLIDAMTRHECGQPIGIEDIRSGLLMAGLQPSTMTA